MTNTERKKIWLSSPHMGGSEIRYVQEAFDTNWIAPLGPHVDEFERMIANYTGTKGAAALSSGTAALHLALIMLGVEKDDFVICQSMTFSASANPIRYLGAVPVFVDSEKSSWNLDPDILEDSIKYCFEKGRKPKAIIVVHLYGMPARMKEIQEIARKYEIAIIEDAAEALGSTVDGKACGSLGDFGVLSFNGNKIITTSGGGALVSENTEFIDRARFLATQARDTAPHYQHSQIGYNYRMSNVCAGIGRGQMEVLDDRVGQRRENFDFYVQNLSGLASISFQKESVGNFSNRWLTCILVDPLIKKGIDREAIRLHLERLNIESRPLWKPMHLQPVFQDFPYFGGSCSEELFQKGLCLPSGSNLAQEDLNVIVEEIRDLWDSE